MPINVYAEYQNGAFTDLTGLTVLGGNLGIGSSSPGTALNVNGTTRSTFFVGDGSGLTGISSGGSGNVGIGTFSPNYFAVYVGISTVGVSNMIMATGNIGIGSVAPGASLDVNGTIRAISFSGSGSGLTGLSVGGWTLGASNVGISTTNNVGIGTNLTTTAGLTVMNGNVGIGTWVTANRLDLGAGFITVGSVAFSGVSGSANLLGSSSPTLSGNPVLGTGSIRAGSSTGSLLNVGGSSNASPLNTSGVLFRAGASGTATDSLLIQGLSGNVGIGSYRSNLTMSNVFGVIGNVGIGTNASSNYINTTAPNGGMIIEGNVGIGSLSPGSIFDIAGKNRITAGGHSVSTGTAPTIANNDCGSTSQGAVVAKSTDNSGTVTVGTLTVTSCAITFASAWVNAPNCLVIDDTSILTVRPGTVSTTKLTINSTTSMSGDNVTWICQGNE